MKQLSDGSNPRVLAFVSLVLVFIMAQIACIGTLPDQTPSSGVATILALTTTPASGLPIPQVPPTITQTTTPTQIIEEFPTPVPVESTIQSTRYILEGNETLPVFGEGTKFPETFEPLTLENIHNVAELKRIGLGRIINIEFSDDNHFIGVETLAGNHLFDAQSLNELEYDYDQWLTEFGPDDADLQVQELPDGIYVVAELNGTIISQLEAATETSFSFSDDHYLVVGKIKPNLIGVWNTDSGELFRQLDLTSSIEELSCSEFIDIAISNNGEFVAAACRDDSSVFLWRTADAILFETIQLENSNILKLKFSNDGKLIGAISSDTSIRLWNTNNGRLQKTMRSGVNFRKIRGAQLAFSRDGYYLVSGFDDGELLVWRVSDGELLRRLSYPAFLKDQYGDGLKLSTEGDLISFVSLHQVITYRIKDEKYLATIGLDLEHNSDEGQSIETTIGNTATGQVRTIDSAPDQRTLAIGFDEPINQVRLYSVDGSEDNIIPISGVPLFVRFARHSDFLAVVTTVGTEIFTGDKFDFSSYLPSKHAIDLVDCAAVSPNGAYLAIGRENIGLTIWSVSEEEIILEIETPMVSSVLFSPGGQFLLYTTDSSLEIVDTDGWESVNSRLIQGNILAMSADGSLILISKPFGGVTIMGIDDMKELISIDLGYPMMDGVFHPVNRWFATASQDGTVRIWGIPPGR